MQDWIKKAMLWLNTESYRASTADCLHAAWAVIEYTTRAVPFDVSVRRDRLTYVGVISHARRILGAEMDQVRLHTSSA